MTLQTERPAPGVMRLLPTRPEEMNTLRLDLLDALDAAIDTALDRGIRVQIVTGVGRAFCGGAHLTTKRGA